tara:strand:+ start:450 stop:839 length:390 start_codon:yes stop_codon:yes gene_type:complete
MSLFSQGIIRVISQPELKYVNDTVVLEFYGGINEGKDRNGQYIKNGIDCQIWGKQATTVQSYVGKGGSFNASGQILMDEWEDKQTGQARKKHKFKISRVELLPKPKGDTPTQAQKAVNAPGAEESDIPF